MLIISDKKGFYETYEILKKEKSLSPMFLKLKRFVELNYGIHILNIQFKEIKNTLFNTIPKNSLKFKKKYELIFYVSNIQEHEKMKDKVEVSVPGGVVGYKMVNNVEKEKAILDYFFELAKEEKLNIKAQKDEIFVEYYFWFSNDYMSYIVDIIEKKITKEVCNRYKSSGKIWEIHTLGFGIYVFYYKDEDLRSNEDNGITDEIRKMYWNEIANLDEFNYYKKEYIVFDSKENVDKNYEGNLYYYFK